MIKKLRKTIQSGMKTILSCIFHAFLINACSSRHVSADSYDLESVHTSVQNWLNEEVNTICITGVSNSGKTYWVKNYLAAYLRHGHNLNVNVVHQDDFWIKPATYNEFDFFDVDGESLLLRNLEGFGAINNQQLWDQFGRIKMQSTQGKITILEGHKILKNSVSFDLCDVSFDILIDSQTGMERRMKRTDYSDPVTKQPVYYRDITLPTHAKYMEVANALAFNAGKTVFKVDGDELAEIDDEVKMGEFVDRLFYNVLIN